MPKLTVAFWSGNSYEEKEYLESAADIVLAHLDMIEHVSGGGWCSVDYGNKSMVVTRLSQLGLTK